ncbi:MAG: hypothetical protein AB7G62_08435 [Magnetospirillum sp.]
MSWWPGLVAALAAGGVVAELALRRANPWRLWRDAFDEAAAMTPHPSRGWMQRPGHAFRFHHRYLRQPVDIRFNRLGLHDAAEYAVAKEDGVFRVALMGCTTAVGWELPADQTLASRLRQTLQARMPGRRVEVMNAAVRLYGTGQLYDFFDQEIAAYRPDLVLYYLNLNHPRRTITAHESGKSPLLSQPVWGLDSQGELTRVAVEPATHVNDMVFLDEDGTIRRQSGRTERSLHRWLLDRSHLYTWGDDLRQGPVRLRQWRDRVEIKDIEVRSLRDGVLGDVADLPYQWRIVARLLERWKAAAHAAGGRFVVAPHLTYYNVRDGALHKAVPQHPWGFTFDNIPERRYAAFLSERLGFPFLDTYAQARESLRDDVERYYVHPRYTYMTAEGAGFIAGILVDQLEAAGVLPSA